MATIAQAALLGAIAGFTIFIGLPVARARWASPKLKGILNAASAGILLFLLVEVVGDAMETVNGHALGNAASPQGGIAYLLLLAGGMAAGLLGLVWFEGRFEKQAAGAVAVSRAKASRMALMMAVGIGLHNFSEGLAIGQSYASGAMHLATLLVVGFALHNATEGFAITAPLSGFAPGWKRLAMLGIIGGGPTFIGTIVGSFWASQAASVLFLSLAAGAIIYVVKEILYHGRAYGDDLTTMAGLLAGFLAGYATDLIIKLAAGG